MALLAPLGACASVNDRLSRIGEARALSAIEKPDRRCWLQAGSAADADTAARSARKRIPFAYRQRAFFKDQRARQIGDILTVRVRVADRANIDNSSRRSRENGENLGVGFPGA